MEPPPRQEPSPRQEPPPRREPSPWEFKLSEVRREVLEITSDWFTRPFNSFIDAINTPTNFQYYPHGSPDLFQYRLVPGENQCQQWPWPLIVHSGLVPVAEDCYQHPPWPLHFEKTIKIKNVNYFLQFQKVPFAYICQEFSLYCIGGIDYTSRIIADDFEINYIHNGVVEVYRVVCEVSQDYEHLISFRMTRVSSRYK